MGHRGATIGEHSAPNIFEHPLSDTAVVLSLTAFDGVGDTHSRTAWQVDTLQGDWSAPVYVNTSSSRLEVDTVFVLDSGVVYKARAAQEGISGGWSTFSDSISFTAGVDVPLFYDGFETGDWFTEMNGISRVKPNSGNCSRYVSDTFNANSGDYVVALLHHGRPIDTGTNCEYRMNFDRSGSPGIPFEIMVQYYLYVPPNFKTQHPRRGRKFFRIWTNCATCNVFSATSSLRNNHPDSNTTLFTHIAETNSELNAGLGLKGWETDPILFPRGYETYPGIYVGEWNKMQYCLKMDTTAVGSFQRWAVNDTIFARVDTTRVYWPRDDTVTVPYLQGLYILGSSASFAENTTFLLDDISIYDDADLCPTAQNPGMIPPS